MADLVKCVCQQRCYVPDGTGITKIRYVGDIAYFDKKKIDIHFKAIDGSDYVLDFRTASESELMEVKWKLSDAKAAIKEHYNMELEVDPNETKRHIVGKIIDIRYRSTK